MSEIAAVSATVRPWYRQLWPWLLISLPLSAVIAGLATWYIAWRSNDGLVADDYYKQGMEINRSLASREIAIQLGLSAAMSAPAGQFSLMMSAEREITFPQRLRLKVLSPVRAGDDREIELMKVGETYQASDELPLDGRWNLLLEDEARTWKLLATAVFPLTQPVVLKP